MPKKGKVVGVRLSEDDRHRLHEIVSRLSVLDPDVNLSVLLRRLLLLLDDEAILSLLVSRSIAEPHAGYGKVAGTTQAEHLAVRDYLFRQLGEVQDQIVHMKQQTERPKREASK